MCLKSTLDKMLRISQLLSQLSISKIDIVDKVYTNSKSTLSSDDMMEGGDSSLELSKRLFTDKVVEIFVYILDLLLVERDSERESAVISHNANSYINMLKNSIAEIPVFVKQNMDKEIYDKFELANRSLNRRHEEILATNLLLCKRAIFE